MDGSQSRNRRIAERAFGEKFTGYEALCEKARPFLRRLMDQPATDAQKLATAFGSGVIMGMLAKKGGLEDALERLSYMTAGKPGGVRVVVGPGIRRASRRGRR